MRFHTFFSCAAFSSLLYPSKTAASAAKISDVWKNKQSKTQTPRLEESVQNSYLVTFDFDFRHAIVVERETEGDNLSVGGVGEF